jgi:hypothetical protein
MFNIFILLIGWLSSPERSEGRIETTFQVSNACWFPWSVWTGRVLRWLVSKHRFAALDQRRLLNQQVSKITLQIFSTNIPKQAGRSSRLPGHSVLRNSHCR